MEVERRVECGWQVAGDAGWQPLGVIATGLVQAVRSEPDGLFEAAGDWQRRMRSPGSETDRRERKS